MKSKAVDKRSRADLDREVFNAFQKHRFGQFDEAFAVYSDVLKIMPEHEDALHYLGLLAQQSGKTEDAAKLIRRSLQIKPENPDALNHLGQIYIALNDYTTAEQCFRQALVYDRNHFYSINNLANCFKASGDLEAALVHYERAVEIEPRSPIGAFNMGNTLKSLGRHWDAIEWLTRAANFERGHYVAYHKLGVCFEQLGRFDEANTNFLKALEYRPDYYVALASLLNSPAYQTSEAEAQNAQQALQNGDITEDTRLRLEHALGKYFDRAGEYESAFAHFRKSNELQKVAAGPFDPTQVRQEFQRFVDFYSAATIRELSIYGSHDQRPIFVVGMPRTGTSLTEQILSSHSGVFGAGELKLMSQIEARIDKPTDQGGLGGYAATPPPLTKETIEYLCRVYLDGLNKKCPNDAHRIVDKFPMNFIHLGLISILFPNARIIHCRRCPLDVALSCYMVLFKMNNDFTTDLNSFGQYYKEYERLMAHWKDVLQTPIFELNYEELVAEPESVLKDLFAHCGLPWEAACLQFDKNSRAVRTPSNWQVRQKMYKSSVNRWKNYASHFLELRSILQYWRGR